MLWNLLGYAVIPMAAMMAASAATLIRPPGPVLRSAVLHLAAGVIFAVVAVEFLPDLLHQHAVAETGVGFGVGTAVMLTIRSLARRAGESGQPNRSRLPVALVFATGVDLVVDGLMLGIGFATGSKQGLLLTAALAIELASLGLALATTLVRRGVDRWLAILAVSGLALLFTSAAAGGGLVLEHLPGRALPSLLAFGSAALLFLVTEELLTEAHETPETPWLTAAFFFGFLLLFLVEMLSTAFPKFPGSQAGTALW